MQKRIPIKNHQQEIQLISQRSMAGFAFICLLIAGLIFRLGYLQLYKHELYQTLSTKNWLDLVPVEPTRGLIYDRNGVLLVENISVYSLDIIPYQVTNLKKSLTDLKKIITLSDSDISQFERQLKQHRRFDEIPLKFRLTEEEVLRFAEVQYQFPGIFIKARLMRHYLYDKSFSHVIGYVGRINAQELNRIDPINYSASNYIGKSGIEKYYEEDMHGNVGYQEVENDASGKNIRVLKEIKSTAGKNIYLTIDSKLQIVAEKALVDHRGAVVAIQPSTGQVLAMVSEPSFDPNLFVAGISQTDYQALQKDLDKPLYDRALRGLYPLASTIKPYLALEGLDSSTISSDFTIYDPGWFELPNRERPYYDWKKGGHGTVNVSKAITSSCDTYFYELALKLGIERIDDILTSFGFGDPTGIDVNNELSGIVASPEWKRKTKGQNWYRGDTVISGIGQGFMQATPLQLASAVATLANRGKRFTPYLLLGSQTPNKPYIQQKPNPVEAVVLDDPKNWDIVIKAMQDVVETPQGTAFRFGHNRNYTIAAKTGTAQVIAKRNNTNDEDKQSTLPERLRDHHLFIAFAPVEKPKIALAIISENSSTAIETARTIFDYYLANTPGTQPNATRPSEAATKKIAP